MLAAGCLSVPPASDADTQSETEAAASTSTSATTPPTSSTTSSSATSDPTTGSSSTGSSSLADSSSGTTGDDGTIDVDGELIEVPPGWQGGVWFDFSDAFLFDADAYFDDPFTFNNAPQSMFILRDPFDAGLGVITVHSVLELLPPNQFADHDFFQVTGPTSGPDALWQAVDCRGWNGIAAGYCLNAGSQGGGDGIFVIAPDWQMSLVETINNCNYLGFDAVGAFDGGLQATLFYGTPDSTILHPMEEVLGIGTQPRVVLEDRRLAVIVNEPDQQRLGLVEPGTYDLTILRTEMIPSEPIARQNLGALRIATGDVSALPGVLYVLVQASELFEYDAAGVGVRLAKTVDDQGWRWASVVIPESSHPLAIDARPTFYILEGNRDLDRDRVIWLQPPPE